MIKKYYELAKPGIMYGNAVTAIAGFFLASRGIINWQLFVAMLLGLSLVIGSACVFNNYLDRDIDAKMARTKARATVTGDIVPQNVLAYGSVLFLLGVALLYFYTTSAALIAALVGFVSYVLVYTPLKRRTVHSTLIGSIAGATPPVVGYCAVTNTWNAEALLLFFILVFWQMPHFYGIAMYRQADYSAASIPLLPFKKGMQTTKTYVLFYIVAFTIAASLLTLLGFTGYVYLAVVLLLGLIWFCFGIKGFKSKTDDTLWGKKMFLFSLVVIMLWSLTLSLSAILP